MVRRPNGSVGAYEARTHFSELLERVAAGEHVTITRHGMPVARLVPVDQASAPSERRAAIDAIRRMAAGNRLGGLKIKDLVREGRR